MYTFVKLDTFIHTGFKSISSFENALEKTSELMHLTVYDPIENKWEGSEMKEGKEESWVSQHSHRAAGSG